jgi:hypothetical protein
MWKMEIDIDRVDILELIPRSFWEHHQLAESEGYSIQSENGIQILRSVYSKDDLLCAEWIMRLTGSDFLCTNGTYAAWYRVDPYHFPSGKICLVEFEFTPPLTLSDAMRAMELHNPEQYQGMIQHRIKKLPESNQYVAYYRGIDEVCQGDILIQGVDMFIEIDDQFHKRFLGVYGNLVDQPDPWFH